MSVMFAVCGTGISFGINNFILTYVLMYILRQNCCNQPTETNQKVRIRQANQATAESRHVKAEAEQQRAKLQPQVSADQQS